MNALPDSEARQVDQHIDRCAECQAELVALEERFGLLRGWADEPPPPDLASRTIARLADEPQQSWWRRLTGSLDRALGRFAAHRPTRLTGFATVALVMLLLVPVLSPNWSRGRSSGAVSGCRVNLRVLEKALDRYARDHHGHYPSRLADLAPAYVRLFPECPSAGSDTYSAGYTSIDNGAHFHLSCHGSHHHDAGLGSDQPEVHQ